MYDTIDVRIQYKLRESYTTALSARWMTPHAGAVTLFYEKSSSYAAQLFLFPIFFKPCTTAAREITLSRIINKKTLLLGCLIMCKLLKCVKIVGRFAAFDKKILPER